MRSPKPLSRQSRQASERGSSRHERFSRAAVDAREEPSVAPKSAPAVTLWASSPLTLPDGRQVVAVRLVRDAVEVRVVDPAAGTTYWRLAETVMSVSKAMAWVRTSRFRR